MRLSFAKSHDLFDKPVFTMSISSAATIAPKKGRSYSDLILAAGVLIIMSLMVLRLPVALIDALVAVNIATGLGLLLIAIYIPTPIAFNSFPSVLLISTLFRLSLSVATTRLILLEADAGHIIDAFGHFVAGGNLVVGLVVFVIITVVQFIVIAKGAERVAEVAARFTLDAMPGKQLSIDSDLRSGLIDKEEARYRRNKLEEESQLNGALDGAMKFVKGDAIASIIIVIVNLVAGLTIGMLQRGMEIGDAVQVYSILTIGDGMVAQIPALLGAMAAGLVVTRTSNDRNDRHLGETIGRQLFAQPRALLVTGLMSVLLAMVPGFPSLVFIGLAAVLLTMAHIAAPETLEQLLSVLRQRPKAAAIDDQPLVIQNSDDRFAQPLVIEYSPDIEHRIFSPPARAAVAGVCGGLGEDLGVPFPQAVYRACSQLPLSSYRVTIFDVETVRRIVTETGDAAHALDQDLNGVLRAHAGRFLGLQEVSDVLEIAGERYPALVKELMRAVSGQTIAEVLRNLVDDGIPIRNLRDILESLIEWGERETDPGALTEFVRIGLKRYITALHVDEDQTLQAIVLHPELENAIRQSLHPTVAGVTMRLSPRMATQLRDNLQTLVDTLDIAEDAGVELKFVLLVTVDIRRHLQNLLRHEFPTLTIVSYQELVMPLSIVPLGQLNVSEIEKTGIPEVSHEVDNAQ